MKSFYDKNQYINIYNQTEVVITDIPSNSLIELRYIHQGIVHTVFSRKASGEARFDTSELHLDISMSPILYIYYTRELNGEIIDDTKEFYLENTSPFETLLTQYIREHDFEGIVDELRKEVVALRRENETQKETLDTLSLNMVELEERNQTLQEENAAKDSRIKELEDRLQELENTDAGEI